MINDCPREAQRLRSCSMITRAGQRERIHVAISQSPEPNGPNPPPSPFPTQVRGQPSRAQPRPSWRDSSTAALQPSVPRGPDALRLHSSACPSCTDSVYMYARTPTSRYLHYRPDVAATTNDNDTDNKIERQRRGQRHPPASSKQNEPKKKKKNKEHARKKKKHAAGFDFSARSPNLHSTNAPQPGS